MKECRFINKNDKISCNNCHIGGFCDEVDIRDCDYKQLAIANKTVEIMCKSELRGRTYCEVRQYEKDLAKLIAWYKSRTITVLEATDE